MRRQAIYGLDLVRFLAASAVLFYHLGFKAFAVPDHSLHLRIGGDVRLPGWSGASWWGWIGVQVFFVISGQVIAYSAEGATWRSFARSRVARLFPAMFICATLIAVVVMTWNAASLQQTLLLWLKSVTFFPLGPWLAGQFWTLPIEIFFYGLVWLMIVAGVARRLEALAWSLALVSAAYWVGLTLTGAGDPYGRLTQLFMLQHGCYFALGILLSIIDRRGLSAGRIVLGMVCLVPAWLQIGASTLAEKPGFGLEAFAIWPFIAWIIAIGLIVASLRWKSEFGAAIGHHGPVVRNIGLATYPLYLIHMHVGGPVLVEALAFGLPAWMALSGAYIVSVVVAWIIAVHLEPPLHKAVVGVLKRMLPDRAAPERPSRAADQGGVSQC